MSQQASSSATTQTDDGLKTSRRAVVAVETRQQLEAVRRLVCRVYIEEMGRDESVVDHNAKTLSDDSDERSSIVASFDDAGNALGTVRWQAADRVSAFDYAFHGFDRLPDDLLLRSSLTTKLIIAPAHRRGTLATRLVAGIFASGYQHGCRVNIINCNPPLDRFFAKLGFVELAREQPHPLYGPVSVMLLPVADRDWFRAIRSPFAGVIDQLGHDDAAAAATRAWFRARGRRYWDAPPRWTGRRPHVAE